MKKFYYIAMLLSLAATNVAAEEFLPIFEPGKMFVYQYTDMQGDYTCRLEYQEETVVDGKKCVNAKYSKENTVYGGTYVSVRTFRESDGCCREYITNAATFVPYEDFNVKAGDVVPMWEHVYDAEGEKIIYPSIDDYHSEVFPWTICKVKEVDSIEVNGIKRRRVRFEDVYAYNIVDEPTECIWVEGIGSNAPDMLVFWSEIPISWTYRYSGDQIFTECYKDGKCIFTEADFHAPALTELREIEADKAAEGTLYDLSGRRVDHPRRGQIYVSNGRKFRF